MAGAARARLAVVGAGWAGLAAAVEATQQGHVVTLFEMAPAPGGRARSVADGDQWLDNGQHILIGAYTDTLRLMRTVGVDPQAVLMRRPLALPDGAGNGLRLPAGPPLLAFGRAVLALNCWPLRARAALLAAAARWALGGFRCAPDLTVGALCRGLPREILQDLIEPLCVAALNTPAGEASAPVFLRVLRDALFSGAGSADLLLPRRPLGDLLPQPAVDWLAQRGARLHLAHRVMSIDPTPAGWRVDDEPFDGVVMACTASEAARLMQPHDAEWARAAGAFRYEPIVTVYARSVGCRLPDPMLRLHSGAGRGPAQFVFDLGILGDRAGLLSFVISAAQPWVEAGTAATAQATLAQANDQLGAHLPAPLEVVRVLSEKRATFRCTPGLQRPRAVIAPGLVAAGDYLEGPYPATLEGAVRSGLAAARTWSST